MEDIKVLVTGAFGHLGSHTVQALFENPRAEITAFDIKSKDSEKIAKKLRKKGKFRVIWGDIRNKESVFEAVNGQNCIIHLAALLLPTTEDNPTLGREVNVNGLINVIEAAERQTPMPRLVFTSSIATMGPSSPDLPLKKVTDPQIPLNEYGKTKIEGEKLLRVSSLPWVILRVGMASPFKVTEYMMNNLFEIPLDQKVEILHAMDAGTALAHAIDADVVNKTLFLGGGESCCLTQREFLTKQFNSVNLIMPPESAFRVPTSPDEWFYMHWMDTEESERLLNYQKHSFDDYVKDYIKFIGFKRHIIKLVKNKALESMLKRSPYYKKP
jgi:nucleoside-diphosphate-sugar epimerase